MDLLGLVVAVVFVIILKEVCVCNGGTTSTFVRKFEKTLGMPLNSDVFHPPPGYNAPQQVHITQGDHEGKGVIISWITPDEPGSNVVYYWSEGDLGQSYDSNITLTHYYELNPVKGQVMLFLGDLSYADEFPFHDNVRWDTWGRFLERSTAYQPWIWTVGNHEVDFAPELGGNVPFKPYTNRYPVPYRTSGSSTPFRYSFKRASSYIIVLSSYSAYGKSTPQYIWLQEEFPKVNRSETPWLIVVMHVPWYDSYNTHYMEGESMRVVFEAWFVKYKVDVVFAGYVHAYERSERVSNITYNIVNGLCTPVRDQSAPVYITVGDGGNLDVLATNMSEPQPEYSAFRISSYGHAMFDIKTGLMHTSAGIVIKMVIL